MPASDQEVLQAVRRDKELDTAYTLPQHFRHMMRARAATPLDSRLVDCLTCGMPELVHFASGLQSEPSAVQAGPGQRGTP